MRSPSPRLGSDLEESLRHLGEKIRVERKRLSLSAIATAEAAGISRVTLHRIEHGEPSVTMGAYLNVIHSLGLELELMNKNQQKDILKQQALLPPRIRIADYPQLKTLAWQLTDAQEVSPKEALYLYERNWRHIDLKAMNAHEREFLEILLAAFGKERLLV
jgi:transcriptional regulator with XRE-family HTH domain